MPGSPGYQQLLLNYVALQSEVERLRERLATSESEKSQAYEGVQHAREPVLRELEESEAARRRLRTEFDRVREHNRKQIAELEDEVATARQRARDAETRVKELERSIQTQHDSHISVLQKNDAGFDKLNKRIAALETENKLLQKQCEDQRRQIAGQTKKINDLIKKLDGSALEGRGGAQKSKQRSPKSRTVSPVDASATLSGMSSSGSSSIGESGGAAGSDDSAGQSPLMQAQKNLHLIEVLELTNRIARLEAQIETLQQSLQRNLVVNPWAYKGAGTVDQTLMIPATVSEADDTEAAAELFSVLGAELEIPPVDDSTQLSGTGVKLNTPS